MRVGIAYGAVASLESKREGLAEYIKLAEDAEQDGFDSVWFAQLPNFADALTCIALAGSRTHRIELGTAVVPTFPRHPLVMARQALTAQSASGGRLTLGIGPSHKLVVEDVLGLSYDRPAQHTREYISVVRALVDNKAVAFSGDFYRVNTMNDTMHVPGAKPLPILLAGLAPIMLRIAGELADGTVTAFTGPKTIETHIVPGINAAAEEAGRPTPRICVSLPVCVTDDPSAARQAAAQALQIYGLLPAYRRMLDNEGVASPLDVAIIGNEAEVEHGVRRIASAGATDLVAVPFTDGQDEASSLARTNALLKSLVGRV